MMFKARITTKTKINLNEDMEVILDATFVDEIFIELTITEDKIVDIIQTMKVEVVKYFKTLIINMLKEH